MNHIPLRSLAVKSLTLLLLGAFALAAAQDKKADHSYKVTIASQMDMEAQGQKQKIDADTEIRYTWRRNGKERTLIFDSFSVRAKNDGKEMMNTTMSREKIVNIKQGEKEEMTIEKAPEQVKKMLQDSFGAPVCQLQVDENGKELKRENVSGPDAMRFADQGMIANALLFHPPYPAGKEEWEADSEISMGNGGFAKGKLTYKKIAGKEVQLVKVSGTLTKDSYRQLGTPVTFKDVRYVINGEETYDPARQEWTSGKLAIDASFQMTMDDKPLGSAKGKMTLSFERLAGKE
jgi:hypothetical protein